MQLNAADLDEAALYKLLTGIVVPRPIAWVSTLSPEGVANLAPFSFYTAISMHPPLLLFSVERRQGAKKDTVRNIEATGEFVIHVVTEPLVEAMVASAADLPPTESEFGSVGLSTAASAKVRVPRIAECPVAMECVLERILEVGSSPHSVVIGQVVHFHIQDDLLQGHKVRMQDLRPMGRLAGDLYLPISDTVSITRRDWRARTYDKA